MEDPNLIHICAIAFLAVICLLGFLALMTKTILWLFPADQHAARGGVEKSEKSGNTASSEEIAAIHSAVQSLAPGWRVIRIEPQNNSHQPRK